VAPLGSRRRKLLLAGFHPARTVARARHGFWWRAVLKRIAEVGERAIMSSGAAPVVQKLTRWGGELWTCARGWVNPPRCPRVSIVIPVYNHCQETMACLESIAEHTKAISHEVIVVDDCSDIRTSSTLKRAHGFKLVRNTKNLGFILSCNRGAEKSRGEYVLF